MISLLILFFGMYWEASMDIISDERNYSKSIWRSLANYFDKKGKYSFGNQFWDNSVSWANKWKLKDPKQGEKFIGSSTIFVTFMDGWHLVKFIWLIHVFAAIVFYVPISGYIIIDVFIYYSVYGLGHEIFSSIIRSDFLNLRGLRQ